MAYLCAKTVRLGLGSVALVAACLLASVIVVMLWLEDLIFRVWKP